MSYVVITNNVFVRTERCEGTVKKLGMQYLL